MRSIAETDLGTPKSLSTETVTLTIDGIDVTRARRAHPCMRAASEAGITIPKLCATETARRVRLVPSVPRARSKARRASRLRARRRSLPA